MTEREPKEIAEEIMIDAARQDTANMIFEATEKGIVEAIQKERTAREDAEKLCDTYRVGYYQRIDRIASLEAALRERDEAIRRAESAEKEITRLDEHKAWLHGRIKALEAALREAEKAATCRAVGWATADACSYLDKGIDYREIEMPSILERALHDLELDSPKSAEAPESCPDCRSTAKNDLVGQYCSNKYHGAGYKAQEPDYFCKEDGCEGHGDRPPKAPEAHESAPKDRVILLDNGGSLLSQPPKPPAPGASEAPECAHVDTLGRGKCDRCGIWEEEYRLLIEPKAKDSSVQKALDENMKKHDGVMRELEDKELGDLAAKRDASAKPEDYVPLEELTAPSVDALSQARQRVIEAARKFHKRCEHDCNDGQVYDTGLCEALSALSELEGGGE